MFLKTSRYYKQKVVEINAAAKKKPPVKAVTLRRLPHVTGNPILVKGNYRLDIIAQRQYRNPTMFWHIADANKELQANDLVEEAGGIINVPEK
jgi:hypothetical protein